MRTTPMRGTARIADVVTATGDDVGATAPTAMFPLPAMFGLIGVATVGLIGVATVGLTGVATVGLMRVATVGLTGVATVGLTVETPDPTTAIFPPAVTFGLIRGATVGLTRGATVGLMVGTRDPRLRLGVCMMLCAYAAEPPGPASGNTAAASANTARCVFVRKFRSRSRAMR